MFARFVEILKLMRRDLIEPAFNRIDGCLFLHKAQTTGLVDKLKVETDSNPDLIAMINEPCEDKFMGKLAEITLYQAALGLLTETITENKDGVITTKTKNVLPDFKAYMVLLVADFPERYGKDGGSGTSVAEWIASVIEVQRLKNGDSI